METENNYSAPLHTGLSKTAPLYQKESANAPEDRFYAGVEKLNTHVAIAPPSDDEISRILEEQNQRIIREMGAFRKLDMFSVYRELLKEYESHIAINSALGNDEEMIRIANRLRVNPGQKRIYKLSAIAKKALSKCS